MRSSLAQPPFVAVLFDLDGTLVDSRAGIEASLRVALSEVGAPGRLCGLEAALGSPVTALFASIGVSLDEQTARAATAAFVRDYDANGWRLSAPYPGTARTMATLRDAGVRMFLVTNKRRLPALAILRHHELEGFIESVYTPDSRVRGFLTKDEMALACLRDAGLHPQRAIVVGDSPEDLGMARACGASFLAAAWGYGHAAAGLRDEAGEMGVPAGPYARREAAIDRIEDLLHFVVSDQPEAQHEP
jgi:phosphoglycolate phosphatase-like HAD superfamily hydrolase